MGIDLALARSDEPNLNGNGGDPARPEVLVESYRRLAEVFHDVLAEQSLEAVLERIATTLSELMPFEALHVYEADEGRRELVPILARSHAYEEEIMRDRPRFGEGLTGWAVVHRRPVWTNRAHLDPRSSVVPGTPVEPEAMIVVPLIARGTLKGALNIYRIGEDAAFAEHEFELAKWFGDAAALALDNAQVRARLEYLAQTDSLTGLYNHRYFHERLRAELTRATRAGDQVAILMFDLDDFKRVNDIYGHGVGDHVLARIARHAAETVRGSDTVCRIGGEEFGVIMPSCDADDALGLAARLVGDFGELEIEPAGRITLSLGVAQGPRHASNPRELVACAEAAMMTAKARGKNQVVVFADDATERPSVKGTTSGRDARSIAHLKMLQSLAGKLNRLNDVCQIGETIAAELRQLIDYHNCRVALREGDDLRPIAFFDDDGQSVASAADAYTIRVGEGITGRVAERGESLLVPNALECEFARQVEGTTPIEESLAAVPLRIGSRVTGAIVISKLGVDQFDDDDVRLLEVLAGQASVALENARLYERERREAARAKALLGLADRLSRAESVDEIHREAVGTAHVLFDAERVTLWVGGQPAASTSEPTAEGVSIALGGDVDSVLVLGRDAVDDDDEPTLAAFAYQVSAALQKALLFARQRDAAEIANALLEAGRELATADSPDEVLRRSVEVTARALATTQASLWIQEEHGSGDLVGRASVGYLPEDDPVGRLRFPAESAHAWLDVEEPFVFEARTLALPDGTSFDLPRAVLAPVRLEGNRVATLAATIGERELEERQLRLLAGLAHQAKLAIESAEHYDGLERTFVSTVAALANALEANDEYTSSHARWITDTALLVGGELHLDREGLKRLELGALFHDIGKIGIPSQILQKAGPLTEEEFAVVRQHPELGERILAPIDRLDDVRPIVRACHERWDGFGYPDGRAGEDIPLEARIVLVCDAFHAMTTDRPYRGRLGTDEAVRRLTEAAGSQFDPAVVETFVRLHAGGALPALD
jgi:diguanylate cyclase (GGDEF)-like protein